MKARIESVSNSHGDIRLSFCSANIGNMVITEASYKEIGSPTVNDVVTISIIFKEES